MHTSLSTTLERFKWLSHVLANILTFIEKQYITDGIFCSYGTIITTVDYYLDKEVLNPCSFYVFVYCSLSG